FYIIDEVGIVYEEDLESFENLNKKQQILNFIDLTDDTSQESQQNNPNRQ
ncbi:3128_t:CDS:1, partial [Gigaspora rosea]